jgi:hypothetical protein
LLLPYPCFVCQHFAFHISFRQDYSSTINPSITAAVQQEAKRAKDCAAMLNLEKKIVKMENDLLQAREEYSTLLTLLLVNNETRPSKLELDNLALQTRNTDTDSDMN